MFPHVPQRSSYWPSSKQDRLPAGLDVHRWGHEPEGAGQSLCFCARGVPASFPEGRSGAHGSGHVSEKTGEVPVSTLLSSKA